MARTYDYSPAYRAVEVVGILAFFSLELLIGLGCYQGLRGPFAEHAWWLVPMAILTGTLTADFISGLFHFLADNFGSEDLPILGPNVIRPFREHHVDPRKMTRHDFIETNGNNCLICIPFLLPIYLLADPATNFWLLLFCSWWICFNFMVLMTNQFHKWSHIESPPAWTRWLQDRGLILSPEHHDLHHTPPFDSYYCITNGWLNPLLQRIRFFQRTEAVIRWITRDPNPRHHPQPRDL